MMSQAARLSVGGLLTVLITLMVIACVLWSFERGKT